MVAPLSLLRKVLWVVPCIALCCVFASTPWAAQSDLTAASSLGNTPPLRVVVYVDPPFVARTSTGLGGFAIELWETIAAANGWKIEYVEASMLPELMDMVSEGQAQVGVTDLFITSGRLKKIDFSQPYFESGLQVMVSSNRG